MITSLLIVCNVLISGVSMVARSADHCVEQINSCSCRTETGYINLSPLDRVKKNGSPRYTDIEDVYAFTYDYNPCTAFNVGDCVETAICQSERSGYMYNLGQQSSATFEVDSKTNDTILTYLHPEYGQWSQNRSAKIYMFCDPSVEGTFKPTPITGNFYPVEFIFTTKYACSDLAPVPRSPLRFSPGTIAIFLVIGVSLMYLTGGVLYKSVFTAATGLNLIPHSYFWLSLPALAKDGVLFVWINLKLMCSTSSRYQIINQDEGGGVSTINPGTE